jgi:hypothetical protein
MNRKLGIKVAGFVAALALTFTAVAANLSTKAASDAPAPATAKAAAVEFAQWQDRTGPTSWQRQRAHHVSNVLDLGR